MIEEEIIDNVNQICEGMFTCLSIQNVNHSPHRYMIDGNIVAWVSRNRSGMLTEDAIRDYERETKKGCNHSGCVKSYDQHTSDRVLFLQLLRNLENKEAADTLYQVRLQVLEPEKIDGITFVETPERYSIQPPEENQTT